MKLKDLFINVHTLLHDTLSTSTLVAYVLTLPHFNPSSKSHVSALHLSKK
jgi:hypothetical protein